MIELMANEAGVLEAMKKIQGIEYMPVSIGVTDRVTGPLIKRLVDMGLILRTGRKKGFKYHIPIFEYKIIERRMRAGAEVNEPMPDSMIETDLTDDQVFYLQNHWDVLPRNILTRRLGITKLQLNFYIDRNKAFLKSVVKVKQTSGIHALA